MYLSFGKKTDLFGKLYIFKEPITSWTVALQPKTELTAMCQGHSHTYYGESHERHMLEWDRKPKKSLLACNLIYLGYAWLGLKSSMSYVKPPWLEQEESLSIKIAVHVYSEISFCFTFFLFEADQCLIQFQLELNIQKISFFKTN